MTSVAMSFLYFRSCHPTRVILAGLIDRLDLKSGHVAVIRSRGQLEGRSSEVFLPRRRSRGELKPVVRFSPFHLGQFALV